MTLFYVIGTVLVWWLIIAMFRDMKTTPICPKGNGYAAYAAIDAKRERDRLAEQNEYAEVIHKASKLDNARDQLIMLWNYVCWKWRM